MSAAEALIDAPVARARPFAKWVGGKRQLLDKLRPLLPATGTYWEPFVGGGAVFFDRLPMRAVLSDGNERLIRTYRAIRNDVEAVIFQLSAWAEAAPQRGYRHLFDSLRGDFMIDRRGDAYVAAWMVALNRLCFNGLYRVNRSGQFNVPFGDYASPTICDAENLRACSRTLQGVRLECDSFLLAEEAKPGDVVYFDPPYVPLLPSRSFRSYTAGGFTLNDQIRLRDLAVRLMRRGVHVVLSNSDTPITRELYADDFRLIRVKARRNINSIGAKRGPVGELLAVAR